MKEKIILIFSLGILSCSVKRTDASQHVSSELVTPRVEIIKFMRSITTQSRSVDEKMFWANKREHAKLTIADDGFIEDVKKLKTNDISQSQFEEYHYAFIVFNSQKIDTLYSDYTLKSWILKNKGKDKYFYDEKGITRDNLQQFYSFFYDCW